MKTQIMAYQRNAIFAQRCIDALTNKIDFKDRYGERFFILYFLKLWCVSRFTVVVNSTYAFDM